MGDQCGCDHAQQEEQGEEVHQRHITGRALLLHFALAREVGEGQVGQYLPAVVAEGHVGRAEIGASDVLAMDEGRCIFHRYTLVGTRVHAAAQQAGIEHLFAGGG